MRHEEYMKQQATREDIKDFVPTKQDHRGMRFAYASAADSYDEKYQVGAVIMKDGIILSDGYNGAPSGFPNITRDEWGVTLTSTLHAEANALMKLAKTGRSSDGATMYCTHSPCNDCTKLMYQAGIAHVVFDQVYDEKTLELVKSLGIKVSEYRRD